MEGLSVETVGMDGNSSFQWFCLVVAFEVIQSKVWLHVNAKEYYNMYMETNEVCGGNIKVIAIDV
jgi:hypothetical protein